MAGKSSWMLPVAAGVAIGWFFSGTLSKILDPIGSRFGITGGHQGYAYPAYTTPHSVSTHPHQPYPSHAPRERRSFDRAYDSWLHNTVNALPSIG
jgi:hypothetical protein